MGARQGGQPRVRQMPRGHAADDGGARWQQAHRPEPARPRREARQEERALVHRAQHRGGGGACRCDGGDPHVRLPVGGSDGRRHLRNGTFGPREREWARRCGAQAAAPLHEEGD